MEPSQLQQPGEIAGLLLRCHLLEKELAASAGLSVDEFHLLTQLHLRAPACVKVLREFLGVDPSRLSKMLHDLEERGYLTRSLDAVDKRKERVVLTEEGIGIACRLLQRSAQSTSRLAGTVTAEVAHVLSSPVPAEAGEADPEVTV